MGNDRQDVIKLAREFSIICENEKLGYTVDTGSMLGAIRNKGMIPGDDDFDVMMTYESYQQLKATYPERVIDTDTDGYPLLLPKFMSNKHNFLKSAVFVDIFLVVPTNEKGIKRFTSFRNKTRFAMQCTHSAGEKFNLGSKIFFYISGPFKGVPKKMSIHEAVDSLSVPADEVTHYYTIDNPIDPIKINKQEVLSMKRKKVSFEDFKVGVPIEYDSILRNKYTDEYMTPRKDQRSIEHVNAISIRKVNRDNIEY